MVYSYFPGCTLKNKASELDRLARACAVRLGFELEELPEWQCCGGVYPTSSDEVAVKLSAVRALASAEKQGRDLVTLCSACHNVIKQTNEDLRSNEYFSSHVKAYLGEDAVCSGGVKVMHYLEVLRDVIGFDRLKDQVVRPLTGKKIGAYYGCLLLRPSKIMAMDDPEDPSIIEDFIRAIGADPVIYSQRNECCGAYLSLEDSKLPQLRAKAVLENAAVNGAQMLITACPLCLYNLNKNNVSDLPVVYFTELLAEALGIKEAES